MHVKGWTPLRDIQPGDFIVETTWLPAFPSCPGSLSDTEIRVLAYLSGAGCYCNVRVYFTQQDNAQLSGFRACIEEMGGSLVKHGRSHWRVTASFRRGRHARLFLQMDELRCLLLRGARRKEQRSNIVLLLMD